MSLDGNAAAVGAPGIANAETGTYVAGAAYVFERSDSAWTQTHHVVLDPKTAIGPHQEQWLFGSAVQLVDQTLVVAAPEQITRVAIDMEIPLDTDGLEELVPEPNVACSPGFEDFSVNCGAVHMVALQDDGAWSVKDSLVNHLHQGPGKFGSSIDFDGTRLAIGAPETTQHGNQTRILHIGAAFLYEQTNNGEDGLEWTGRQLGTDASAGGRYYGLAVALGEGFVAVGAPGHGEGDKRLSGGVHLFEQQSGSEIAFRTAPNAAQGHSFGRTLSLDGDTLLVGAPGEGNSTTTLDNADNTKRGWGAAYTFEVHHADSDSETFAIGGP